MRRFLQSIKYTFAGLIAATKSERNMKFHLFFTLLVLIAGWLLCISTVEWMLVSICVGMVISLEVVNTAIERMVDIVSTERRPELGQIKDIAGAAVFIGATVAAIVGVLIFLPKIIDLIF
jgi:diacylglycerol kinase